VFILRLRNYGNVGMLWFLECSTYFVVDDLILLFVALVEILGLCMASLLYMKVLVICE
jgi:hypothetical protein